MTILTLGSVLLGAVLGRFFKVWILIPTGGVAVMAAFASAIYQDAGLLRAFFECAVLMTCLQIGYVSGVFSHLSQHAPPAREHGSLAALAFFLNRPASDD